MASVQWNRLKETVDAYHGEAPEDLEAWLDEHCGDDDALRQEAESLLQADQEGRLSDEDRAADRLSVEGSGEASALPSSRPQSVGPYRLLEEIGVGGMSVVYRAERTEADFQQTVAVKVLQRRLGDEEARRRFQAERQVLASLDHPSIAQFIDGGVTDGGRPYLVMVHVEGAPITEYARENDLDLGARLDLIEQVAEALEAAHRQLVVHRDLKPSNVFVTETETGPRVKLLDFGIAKLLGDTLPVTRPQTRTGRRPMTPSYAAPEQVIGDEISTQTDVYQLGMLAYELLAGRRPFDLGDTSLAETERIITEKRPPPPSEQATSEGVSSAELRGDLDVIVRKALRKEPDRRYTSVEALVADLRRYQRDEPVEARPATLGYRTRKFLRRNRAGVAVAGAFLAVIAVSAVLLVQQRNQAQQEAERAQREAQKAEAVSGYLTDLLQSARPDESAGDTVTAADMLRRGQEQIDRLDGQPAAKARMLQLLGNAYRERASYEKAAGLLRRSLRTRDSLYAGAHKAVANTLEEIAHLHQQQGRYQKADSLWRRALRAQKGLFGPENPKLWEPLNNLGITAEKQGEVARADSLYQAAFRAGQSAEAPDTSKLATTLGNQAGLHAGRGEYARADSLYRKAFHLERRIYESPHPSLTRTIVNLGYMRIQQEQYGQADSLLRKALRSARQIYDAPHPLIATALTNLAGTKMLQGNLSAADRLVQRAIAIDRQTKSIQHPTVGIDLTLRGKILTKQQRFKKSLSIYREAQSILEEQLPSGHLRLAAVREGLGQALTELGQYQKAESLLKRSLEIFRSQNRNTQVQEVRERLTELYAEWGKPGKAAQYRSTGRSGNQASERRAGNSEVDH